MDYFADEYDVVVIGAGHAGIEACLASSKLGCKTAVFTLNLDWIGNMPCNPSIGGTSKGHLVREIDALGGEMGHAADATLIQSRMLNLGKGPAVHSLRAQIDRKDYSRYMKHVLEKAEGLDLLQGEVVSIELMPDGCWRLKTRLEAIYTAKAVVIATGTFLRGKIYVGEVSYAGGPDGMFPADSLADSLAKLNLPIRRFKTGTPPRVNRRSINFDGLEPQYGDDEIVPFSFDTVELPENKSVCYLTYTNSQTKKVILDNLDRSPLYSKKIEGVGPRYCPSIEDKVVRFSEKDRHQIFIEPCGLDTEEMYLQGMSSSLPCDVQIELLKTVPGLENLHVMRNAYAIEYDCIDPLALKSSLEFKDCAGLFGAGQFNGSSGYEEAAAQGLIAGINAAQYVKKAAPLLLDRTTSYIGTLIDDLVTKGCADPYRMMTSRSEFRLTLRQDNADLRLSEAAYGIGMIDDARYQRYLKKTEEIKRELDRVEKTYIYPSDELNKVLVSHETSPLERPSTLKTLLRRPQLSYKILDPFDVTRPNVSREILGQVEIETKYEGYIKRQYSKINEIRRLEEKKLPIDIDYQAITGIRLEAAEKLQKHRPENIGQASRISGVNPSDISVLLIYLRHHEVKK